MTSLYKCKYTILTLGTANSNKQADMRIKQRQQRREKNGNTFGKKKIIVRVCFVSYFFPSAVFFCVIVVVVRLCARFTNNKANTFEL